MGRKLFDYDIGLVSAALVAVNPLLYQDGLYARPESFVTILTLAYLMIIFGEKKETLRLIFSGLILGILIATKLSMIILAPLIYFIKPYSKNVYLINKISDLNNIWYRLLISTCAILIGLLLFIPYAFINPEIFIHGINTLSKQYTSGHWPHGITDGTIFSRLFFSINYFLSTIGYFAVFMFLASVIIIYKNSRFKELICLIIFLVFFIRFSTYPVFFERNVSHLIPIFLIFSSFAFIFLGKRYRGVEFFSSKIINKVLSFIALTFCLFILFFTSVRTALNIYDASLGHPQNSVNHIRDVLEKKYNLKMQSSGWITYSYHELSEKFVKYCGPVLLEFFYPNDKYSNENLMKLINLDGFKEVARYESRFNSHPSTLNTYFMPTKIFLYRGLVAEKCRGLADVKIDVIGSPLKTFNLYADSAWTLNGSFPGVQNILPGNIFYGSWSGTDLGKGALTYEVKSRDSLMILPYLTGPVSANQSIVVKDINTNEILFNYSPIAQSYVWRFLLIDLKKPNRNVLIHSVDNGAEWGEWHAIGTPMTLKDADFSR